VTRSSSCPVDTIGTTARPPFGPTVPTMQTDGTAVVRTAIARNRSRWAHHQSPALGSSRSRKNTAGHAWSRRGPRSPPTPGRPVRCRARTSRPPPTGSAPGRSRLAPAQEGSPKRLEVIGGDLVGAIAGDDLVVAEAGMRSTYLGAVPAPARPRASVGVARSSS
jgi:hypothetical protein